MKKLDLHGVRHNDVQFLVDRFIWENRYNLPIDIVTGYSEKMKEIVIDIIKEHGYDYIIGDTINKGYIRII